MTTDTRALIASTRMYNVAPAAMAAWHLLLDRVIRDSGVPLQILEHAHPASLSSLWDRADLGCAFMCGWPLALERGTRPVIAAPVPSGEAGPRYHSVFIVAADTPFETLEQIFGHRFAFNSRESHSGWNMPQAHVAALGGAFGAVVGPYGPHRLAAAAVVTREAEAAAIDSLVWALLCRHAPEVTAALRVVGRTADQPSPPLVGSAALPEWDRLRLQEALCGLADDPAGRTLLEDVCLAGFAPATLADYEETLTVGRS